MPEIRKLLVLSTAHLTEEHGRELDCIETVVAYRYGDYGWFMWVPDSPIESSEIMATHVPPKILAVQLFARGLGCDFVLFDVDGDTVDPLPIYDW